MTYRYVTVEVKVDTTRTEPDWRKALKAQMGSIPYRIVDLPTVVYHERDDELYDDGKVLIAGVLYDNETLEEADPQ